MNTKKAKKEKVFFGERNFSEGVQWGIIALPMYRANCREIGRQIFGL